MYETDIGAIDSQVIAVLYRFMPKRIPINSDTRIGEDLMVIGDTADEFLTAIRDDFEVDFSNFDFSKYFPGEFDQETPFYEIVHSKPLFDNAIFIFLNRWRKARHKKYEKHLRYKTLTVRDISRAIQKGTMPP